MERNVYTVSQINKYVGGLLREDFLLHRIAVTGEVSNFVDHSSGHIYLTLKDEGAEIKGVMFRSRRGGMKGRITNGDKVIATGEISLYEKNGTCQIYIDRLEKAGEGDIYARIEELKKQLAEMGMFDPMYKKKIPPYARKVGIVTAPTGAAVRDIIQISRRRNPYVQLILCPAIVQGKDAPASIVRGIERLDALGLDVIIVGRGGGSVEDLFAFNSEDVARAIFQANTPIVSAVGHQTDTTIADYVADLRAPTPSAAAELCVFDYYEVRRKLDERKDLLANRMRRMIRQRREQAMHYERMLANLSPQASLERMKKDRIRLGERLEQAMAARIREAKLRQEKYTDRIERIMPAKLDKSKNRLAILAGRLDGLSPAKKLSAGYAYVRTSDGKRIEDAGVLSVGDELDVSFLKGRAVASVTEIYK